jgi:hypothetical protein
LQKFQGAGVFETLEEVAKLILAELKKAVSSWPESSLL